MFGRRKSYVRKMTVSYNLDVSSVSTFSFFKLLFRWRGSIWKSVIGELTLWLFLYYSVFFTYRYALQTSGQLTFAKVAKHCDKKLDYIPLTFMLGFFVTIIVERWRNIFKNMGWIENVALTVSTILQGDQYQQRIQRRSIIRYLVLSQVLVFRDISMRVRRRFPNMESLIKAGFIQEHELCELNNIELDYNKYWVPVNWALSICQKAHKEGSIAAPPSLNNIISEIRVFRSNLALLCNYDWVPIPIAYPQVVFLAVRVHFLICCISRQFLIEQDNPVNNDYVSIIDLYVPFMTILQFIFVVGWMKVAEALLNPLGEDDDDFECNFLIDKNMATGMSIVDDTFNKYPDLRMDKFMDKNFQPVYSEESTRAGVDAQLFGSAQLVTLAEPEEDVKMVSVDRKMSIPEDFDHSRKSTTSRIRRRFSTAFNGSRNCRAKVTPIELGVSLPPNFSLYPERPSVPGSPYKKSPSIASDLGIVHALDKVIEEELSNSKSSNSSDTKKENIDDEIDDEIHEVIRNEIYPPPEKF